MADARIERIVSLMFTVGRLVREQAAGRGNADPLPLLQLKVLSLVSEKGAPTMKDIADSLYITPPSATAAIGSLVRDAQLKRVYDAHDRRVTRLTMTRKGKKRFKERRGEVIERMAVLLGALNAKEKAAFAAILAKIIRSYKR